jgi:hypothetical protein
MVSIELLKAWSGIGINGIDNPPEKPDVPIQIRKDQVGMADFSFINTLFRYDTAGDQYRVMAHFDVRTDNGSWVQKFDNDLPFAGEGGTVGLRTILIPPYAQYRTTGPHTMRGTVTLRNNGLMPFYKPVIGTFTFEIQYQVVE